MGTRTVVLYSNSIIPTGAGISVQAGIPDFRSSEGLFKTLKRDNPREALVSGKDLFDASVFNVRSLQPIFFVLSACFIGKCNHSIFSPQTLISHC